MSTTTNAQSDASHRQSPLYEHQRMRTNILSSDGNGESRTPQSHALVNDREFTTQRERAYALRDEDAKERTDRDRSILLPRHGVHSEHDGSVWNRVANLTDGRPLRRRHRLCIDVGDDDISSRDHGVVSGRDMRHRLLNAFRAIGHVSPSARQGGKRAIADGLDRVFYR